MVLIIRNDITAYAGDFEGKFPSWVSAPFRSKATHFPDIGTALTTCEILRDQGQIVDLVEFEARK